MGHEELERVQTRKEKENDIEKTDNQEANITIRQTQPVKRSVIGQRKSKQTSHLFLSARASDAHKRVFGLNRNKGRNVVWKGEKRNARCREKKGGGKQSKRIIRKNNHVTLEKTLREDRQQVQDLLGEHIRMLLVKAAKNDTH